MAQVGDSAYTDHGIGKIAEILNERGRLSYRVAGAGFNVWVDQARLRVAHDVYGGLESTIDPGGSEVNEHNHTTLPYTWEPQHHDDLFRAEQTILPGDWETDPDDRLHPSDSVSGDKRTDVSGPQPSPALFATPGRENPFADERTSGKHENLWVRWQSDDGRHQADDDDDDDRRTASLHQANPALMAIVPALARGVGVGAGSELAGDLLGGGGGEEEDEEEKKKRGELEQLALDESPLGMFLGYRPAGLDKRYAHFEVEAADHDSPVAQFRRDPISFIHRCGHLWTDGDDALDFKYADYTQLIDVDPRMRESAWSDVRRKAMRLRREGKITIHDHGAGRIYATVEGDNGVYDTMIVKGGSYGGLGGGQSVTDWTCSCEWGRWAFKRQMTYVGRLCSHGYATYLEMQSRDVGPDHFKKKTAGGHDDPSRRHDYGEVANYPESINSLYEGGEPSDEDKLRFFRDRNEDEWPAHPGKHRASVEDYKSWLQDSGKSPEAASVTNYLNTQDLDTDRGDVEKLYDYVSENPAEVPERDFEIDYPTQPDEAYKTAADAELLHQRPVSLSPNLRAVPGPQGSQFVDVTEDDRETTAPDQIVHFSAQIARALHPHYADIQPDLLAAGAETYGEGVLSPPVDPTTQAQVTAALHRTAEDDEDLGYSDTAGGRVPRGLPQPPEPAPDGPDIRSEYSQTAGGRFPNGLPGKPLESAPAETEVDTPDLTAPSGPLNPNGVLNGPANAPRSVTPADIDPGGGSGFVPSPGPGGPPSGPASPPGGGPNPPGAPSAAPEPPGGGGGEGWKANDIAENSIKPTNGEYKIQQGDTLAEIAQGVGYGGDYKTLAEQNKIADPDKINAGDTIKIPGLPGQQGFPGAPPELDTKPIDGEQGGPKVEGDPAENTPGLSGAPAQGPKTPPPAGEESLSKSPTGGTPPPANPAPAAPGLPAEVGQVPGSTPPPAQPTAPQDNVVLSSLRYAESSDSALLDKLRELSTTPAADSLGHMDSRNDELRDVVDELQDRGYDASFMVAALDDAHFAASPPTAGDPNFLGLSAPNWADEPSAGSGPSPKKWISDSVGYVEENEYPHHETDWTDAPEGDIIKFNDSRSRPEQGPRHTGSFDPVAAFDRGEFDAELPRLHRAGRGSRAQVRVDPGTRDGRLPGQAPAPRTAAAPPEDFGYDGGPSLDSYDQEGGNDIVAAFHRSGGAAAVMSESRGGNDDIAARAQAFLRTAGRKYSPEEQRELEAEFHPQGARNLPDDDDLAGTHYLLGL